MATRIADVLHEPDFHAWTRVQAAALRRAAAVGVATPARIDWQGIAQELERMGQPSGTSSSLGWSSFSSIY